jgi:hypothetical protein
MVPVVVVVVGSKWMRLEVEVVVVESSSWKKEERRAG